MRDRQGVDPLDINDTTKMTEKKEKKGIPLVFVLFLVLVPFFIILSFPPLGHRTYQEQKDYAKHNSGFMNTKQEHEQEEREGKKETSGPN